MDKDHLEAEINTDDPQMAGAKVGAVLAYLTNVWAPDCDIVSYTYIAGPDCPFDPPPKIFVLYDIEDQKAFTKLANDRSEKFLQWDFSKGGSGVQ